MDSKDAKLVEEILFVLIGLLPGGSTARDLAKPLIVRLLAGTGNNPGEAALRRKAQDIAAYLVALEEAGHTNPGSGYSARIDFLAIIGKTDFTPERLIELGLDHDQLMRYLTTIGKEELAEASQGRRSYVMDALRQFADAVLEIAPDLPSVRLAFMQAMLRNVPSKTHPTG